MKKILVGTAEIEVQSFTPYAYMSGKGEKVLQIKVSADTANFESLRELLENTEESIQYFEDNTLVCEYVGYGKFEAQYSGGVYSVEMHKTSIDEQISALLVANEKLNTANAALQATAETLTEQNAILEEQNEMLTVTLTDVLEDVIPNSIEEIIGIISLHEERLTALETVETVTDETVSE